MRFLGACLLLWLAAACQNAHGCTSITVGAKAGALGNTYVSHSMDEGDNDFRVVRVPAMTHQSKWRPVYAENEPYPRFVRNDIPGYRPVNGQKLSQPIGQIPQVPSTYAYWDLSYGALNEHNLAIGESTCGAKTLARALPVGKALFWVSELSHVAMERCKTAVCAIRLMGELATAYGFYGEREEEGSAETLSVCDPQECWVFHVLSDTSGASAIWAAQRVPDDHVAVVANMFVIRYLPTADNQQFMMSENVRSQALQEGWWDGQEPFDFTHAYSIGEYSHKYYSARRMWRVFDWLAPSLHLNASLGVTVDRPTYPFSVRPDRPVHAEDLMNIHRDHYEGTPFDLTKGMAAGPFGTPNRYAGGSNEVSLHGGFERAISMYRTSYAIVGQLSSTLPREFAGTLWLAPDAPHSSVYSPLFSGQECTPDALGGEGHQGRLSRKSLWWAFDFVSNWMDLKYGMMMENDVAVLRDKMQAQALQLHNNTLVTLSDAVQAGADPQKLQSIMCDASLPWVEQLLELWWDFADMLVVKYNDGYVNVPNIGHSVGYPTWWLEKVGFTNFPNANAP